MLANVQLGLGTWAWGDRVVWQFGRGYGETDIRAAFETAMAEGIQLVETAEVYGSGRSERFVGEFARAAASQALIATRFFPWPWRLSTRSVLGALRGSLGRLGLKRLDLYQVHNPLSPMGIEAVAEAMVACVDAGLTSEVGVANFDEGQMLRAYTTMTRHNVHLASNQVHYSLLQRQVEKSGLLARCKELGIRLLAYSPLEMGLLTGKYDAGRLPPASRAMRYATIIPRMHPLLKLMTEIGQDQGGKSNAQIALNWLIVKGAIPIPGAKNADQAHDNAGALGWSLTSDEVAALDTATDSIT